MLLALLFHDIKQPMNQNNPPICDYEGSDYQQRFWESGGRVYEDAVEAIALKRLLPPAGGAFMLELGAGAGRNTHRYQNYERIVLLDYSRSQLEQARNLLGDGYRYTYVAADVYRLPFIADIFDGATMIRTLHHMAEPQMALAQVHQVMAPQGVFVLEYANKRNLKAMFRYLFRRQAWSPYSLEPVEFAELNFDFHPKAIRGYLDAVGFAVERQLTVSHFRMPLLKRVMPLRWLTSLDSLLQGTGNVVQVSPSVFVRCRASEEGSAQQREDIFQCPRCRKAISGSGHDLSCHSCGTVWEYRDGIYDFRVRD